MVFEAFVYVCIRPGGAPVEPNEVQQRKDIQRRRLQPLQASSAVTHLNKGKRGACAAAMEGRDIDAGRFMDLKRFYLSGSARSDRQSLGVRFRCPGARQ